MKAIRGFKDQHRFMSNFWYHPVKWNGVVYPTNEHAYVAAKSRDPKFRAQVLKCKSPADVKRVGRLIKLRPGWDSKLKKVRVMRKLIRRKYRDPELRKWLLSTEGIYLEETNRWHDNFWGVCTCKKCCVEGVPKGKNWLGRLTMEERDLISLFIK